jgi:hypothetical protein
LKRLKNPDLRIEKVKNASVTKIEITPPVVIELLPGYELTVEDLTNSEYLEVEIWKESLNSLPVKLSFRIVLKDFTHTDFEPIHKSWN